MILSDLEKKGLIKPPSWLVGNTAYLVIMGSEAYGCSSDNSDRDLIGFCIPEKNVVFPHLAGAIPNFGRQKNAFNQYQQHHIVDPSAMGGKGREYDVNIYNIVKFFMLVMENNPNMIDALFVPQNCIVHCTKIGHMVRERRKMFLHKGSWHRFKGYAFSQMKKMKSQTRKGKRAEQVAEYGYDLKFAYHVVRLLGEVEQILVEGDIDLQRDKEHLKAIRRGDWTLEQIETYFASKELQLEEAYSKSELPYGPDEAAVKQLLLDCLEEHYGNLTGAFDVAAVRDTDATSALDAVVKALKEHGRIQ